MTMMHNNVVVLKSISPDNASASQNSGSITDSYGSRLKRSSSPWLCRSAASSFRSSAINDHATDNQDDQSPTENHVHGTPHPTLPADPLLTDSSGLQFFRDIKQIKTNKKWFQVRNKQIKLVPIQEQKSGCSSRTKIKLVPITIDQQVY